MKWEQKEEGVLKARKSQGSFALKGDVFNGMPCLHVTLPPHPFEWFSLEALRYYNREIHSKAVL